MRSLTTWILSQVRERTILRTKRRQATERIKAHDYAGAVSVLEDMRQDLRGGLSPASYIRLSRAYKNLGNVNMARETLLNSLAYYPGNVRLTRRFLAIEAARARSVRCATDSNTNALEDVSGISPAFIRSLRSCNRNIEAFQAGALALKEGMAFDDIASAMFSRKAELARHVYIIIRHSVFTVPNRERWRVGRRTNVETYRERLFSPERLASRLRVFRHITLPSLAAQELPAPDSMTVLILTSQSLPESYKGELREAVSGLAHVRLEELNEHDGIGEQLRPILEGELQVRAKDCPVTYASVWLDDDDALSRRFVRSVYRYLDPAFNGLCVSFPVGFHGVWDERCGKLMNTHSCYSPKIALGLSHISTYEEEIGFATQACSVYHVRNLGHKKIDRSAPTILDSSRPMYFRTHHAASDLNRLSSEKRLKRFFGETKSVPRDWDAIAEVVEIDRAGLEAGNSAHVPPKELRAATGPAT